MEHPYLPEICWQVAGLVIRIFALQASSDTYLCKRALRGLWCGRRSEDKRGLIGIRGWPAGLAFSEIFESSRNMDDRLRCIFLGVRSRAAWKLRDNLLRSFLRLNE